MTTKKSKAPSPAPPTPTEGHTTVGDVRVQLYIQRLAQREAAHAEELVNLQIEHLVERDRLQSTIRELQERLAELSSKPAPDTAE